MTLIYKLPIKKRRLRMVSEKLIAAVKLAPEPAYRIAHRAALDPSMLSKLLCGIVKVKEGDPRVIAVGRVLGVPEGECFQEEPRIGEGF